MFPYVSTRVLVCTVATIVMSQSIYPPNLLLLQDRGPALSPVRLSVSKWGSLPALAKASVTRSTTGLCEVEACTSGVDIATLSSRLMYAMDGSWSSLLKLAP